MKGMNKKMMLSELFAIFMMLLLSFVRALGTYVFIVPNAFAPGGIGGLSSILYNVVALFNPQLALTWFNPAVTMFVLNIPIFILSFVFLDKRFTWNTIFCVTAFSLFMGLFSIVDFPTFAATNYESSIMIVAAVVGGVLGGIGLGFLLKFNTCMGGTDTIGKIVYKKNPILDVQWIIFICDCVVAFLSGIIGILTISKSDSDSTILVKILAPVLFSFLSLFCTSKVADIIQIGMKSSLVINVVTDKAEIIGKAIVDSLHKSGTIIKVEGIYTHSEKQILVCVLRKKQVMNFKKLIKQLDDKAFMYITEAQEVRGMGFLPIDKLD